MKKNKKDNKAPTERLVKLKNLPAGTPFIFSSGSLSFKNMVLIYSGDARCVVEGFKNEGKNEEGETVWNFFKDNCAPDAEVVVDKSRTGLKIVQDSFGSHKIKNNKKNLDVVKKKEDSHNNMNTEINNSNANDVITSNDVKNDVIANEPRVNKKRGRKPGVPKIAFPASREFTAPEIVQELGLQPYVVSNELNKALREGRIVKVGAIPSNKGRGRHCKVFKTI